MVKFISYFPVYVTIALDDVEIAATNLERLPKYAPHLCSGRPSSDSRCSDSEFDRINERVTIRRSRKRFDMSPMKAITASLDKQMSTMNNNVQKQLDHLD